MLAFCVVLGILGALPAQLRADRDHEATGNFLIGAGKSDITGPAAEVNMMGYANPAQTTKGIHLRQYSRAFIIADSKNTSRIVLVSIDGCMVGQLVKIEVLKRLQQKYGDLYKEENVCISGIHTHSGPGGFLQYVLYDITSLGFVKETLTAMVEGIVRSIELAHENIAPGNIMMNEGELLDANINRSPSAYLNNPKSERARHTYNVDKNMTVLKMTSNQGNPVAMLNWFPVHCTSMNNTNMLISADNKGYASYLFEKQLNHPGKDGFVAAFAQSNEGDVSPNTKGPHCLDTGLPCDVNTSTCHGKNELCIAFGPGKDMFDSTKIIGERQYNKAMSLFNNATRLLSGSVEFRSINVDMTAIEVQYPDNKTGRTCKPAMGYAFAAGTTDGPGAFNFHQSSTTGNLFWNLVRDILKTPTKEQMKCHHPKPILLDTGEVTIPYEWEPKVVTLQLFRIGELFICSVPAEFTTMSGRRMREAIKQTLIQNGVQGNIRVVIAGLSNAYASYVTTYEEYQVQRYEGGSTIFGPHTLQAYIQEMSKLAVALAKNETVAPGPAIPDLSSKQLSFLPPVVYDGAPFGKKFGSVVRDAKPKYMVNSTVSVTFVSGHPRNNLMTGKTFLTVNYQHPVTKQWQVQHTDADWETRFEWHRTSSVLGESEATVYFDIPHDAIVGTYMISHFGYYKSLVGSTHPYSGNSSVFAITVPEHEHRLKNKVGKISKKIKMK